uniref:Lipoprotein n=1 Tax=uncultured bacterium contig00068 TaxID=1181549 RepID=A0A806KRL4_9BACT|nr:hypothetical protein [uncultured bacterium contig00068]
MKQSLFKSIFSILAVIALLFALSACMEPSAGWPEDDVVDKNKPQYGTTVSFDGFYYEGGSDNLWQLFFQSGNWQPDYVDGTYIFPDAYVGYVLPTLNLHF